MKPSIDELKDRHIDKPIVVLGAGEDLQKDVEEVSKWIRNLGIQDYITIVANDKPLQFYPNPDYVFVISKALSERVCKITNPDTTIRISTLERYSDYRTNRKSIYYGACGAGALATSLAYHLGGDPIILCGFDLFRKNHCDGIDRKVTEKKIDLNHLINKWTDLPKFHKKSNKIKVVGDSPLSKVFDKLL